MPAQEMEQYRKANREKQTPVKIYLNKGDLELVTWGAEFLGCSKADFYRTAIRAYTMALQQIQKGIPK